MTDKRAVVPLERIESHIVLMRGQKVMLSTHLADLYEVEPASWSRRSSATLRASWRISCSS